MPKLSEIRCETCMWRGKEMRKGHVWKCDNLGLLVSADFACAHHFLWKQALAEEKEQESAKTGPPTNGLATGASLER